MKHTRLRRIFLAFIVLITVIYNGIVQAAPDNAAAAGIVAAIASVVDISTLNLIMIILGVIVGAIEALAIILGDDIDLKPSPPPSNRTPEKAEQDYLEGRLDQFQREESLFIPLEMQPFLLDFVSNGETFDTIEKAIGKHGRRFVLVGNPGGGKSTTLRDLFRKQARAYQNPDTKERKLPLWIDLGLSNAPIDAKELIEFWWRSYYLPDTPDQYIAQRKLMLYLDGLNELPLDTRKERAKSLREFIAKLPDDFPVIITCRVRDYVDDEDLKMGDLPIVEVKPLTETQTQEFIAKRLNQTDAITLWNTLHTDKTLLALAENPYYLTMLVQIYPNIPKDLSDLFGRYFNDAYDNYTKRYAELKGEKVPKEKLIRLKKPVLEKRLKRLAFRMMAYGGGTSVSMAWVKNPSKNLRLLPLIRKRKWRQVLEWWNLWIQPIRIGKQTLKDGINLGVLQIDSDNLRFYHQALHGYFAVDLLSDALEIRGGIDRFTKNPVALIRQIGDLAEAGMPAVPALINALKNKDENFRRDAAEALGKIGDERTVEPLITTLMDADSSVRFAGSKALSQIGIHSAEPLLALNREMHVPKEAIWALDRLRDIRAVEPFITLLKDTKKDIRSSAATALGNLRDKRAVEPLIVLLKDTNDEVRASVVKALGKIGDERAVDALIITLTDKNLSVRYETVQALWSIGDERAIPPLIAALRDRHWAIRESVETVLVIIGTPEALDGVNNWKEEQVSTFLAMLTNSSEYDRQSWAARRLEEIGTPEALAAVRQWREEQE